MLHLRQALHFGVGLTRLAVMAFRHDSAVVDQDSSDRWIRTGATEPFACLSESRAHEAVVVVGGHHG